MGNKFLIRIFVWEFLVLLGLYAVIQILLTYFSQEGPEKWDFIHFFQNRMLTGVALALVLAVFRTIKKSGQS